MNALSSGPFCARLALQFSEEERTLPEASRPSPRSPVASFALIAGVVAFVAAAFAYTAGGFRRLV